MPDVFMCSYLSGINARPTNYGTHPTPQIGSLKTSEANSIQTHFQAA
ncbi:hypothetical protein [Kingella sp. (in: b-proteobacteria)]|nr:hypothetical protein [Kingella sp. (in: b-proteobacteria)]MDO4657261.1 hypothetical protein [Kingella sp. (in: b-proteobacteria)]